MRLLASLLRPRARRAHKSTRAFRPAVVGLEDRNLLSLSMVSAAAFRDVTPDSFTGVNLGRVLTGNSNPLNVAINWGDGATSSGSSAPDPSPTLPGVQDILGSHTYATSTGSYWIRVTVTDPSGARVSFTDPVTLTSTTLTLTEDTPVGLFPDVVGAPFSDRLTLKSSDPSSVLVAATWSFQSPDGRGVIASQTVDSTGYHNTYVRQVNKAATGLNEIKIDAYDWGATPGLYTVTANASYVDSKGAHQATRTMQVNVVAPEGSLTAKPSQTTMTPDKTGGGGILKAGDAVLNIAGIQIRASVNPSILDQGTATRIQGTYGVVQTIKYSIVTQDQDTPEGPLVTYRSGRLSVDGNETLVPLDQYPATWVDQLSKFKFPYYNFSRVQGWPPIPTPATVGSGLPTIITDSPQAEWNGKTLAININAQFVDALMFTPPNGVAVPLGSLTWSWRVSASRPNVDALMAPTAPWSDITATTYRPGSTFPTWDYNGLTFLNPDNDGVKNAVVYSVPDNYRP